jgi:sugar lactone lactonase YvrE
MRRLGTLHVVAVLLSAGLTATAGPAKSPGDLFVLGIGLNQEGQPGGWVAVGEAGGWKDTRAAAVLKGRLYTVKGRGSLWATDLKSGRRTPVATAPLGAVRFLFAAGDSLLVLGSDGSLDRLTPNNGGKSLVGPAGAWRAARAGVVLADRLYTIETDGTLWSADLATGARTQLGKPEFANAASLFALDDALCICATDGSLFRVNPRDGSESRISPVGSWKSVRAGTGLEGRLYAATADGALRAADPATGKQEQLGSPEYANTAFMVAAGNDLYTIETDGTLYRVIVHPADSVDSYNWCPEEVEKVFREQGKDHYRHLQTRLVLGKQATHAGVMDGLAWLQQHATKQDLAVLYVGCHGFTDPNDGWGFGTADGKTLYGREIKTELAKLPCHVLVLIETCASGGFAETHKNDPPVPDNVTAVCACSGKQSTDNQLDMAVFEALYGRADFNHDGVVDLDELIRYVQLRYREWWPEPKKMAGSETPITVRAKTVEGALPLTSVARNLVAVAHGGTWYSALEEKREGDKVQIHLLGWSSKPGPYFLTNTVPRECVCQIGDGQPLLVEQDGLWSPARGLSREGDRYRVHYIGTREDEVVARERIMHPFAAEPGEKLHAATAGAWEQVGPAGAWKDTLAGTILNGRLYTVESSGALYVTNLRTGKWKQLGQAEFADTTFLFAAGGKLYTIEKDGSLYRVEPGDGSWVQVGPAGAWKDTLVGTVLNGRLYTVESSGGLYVTDLDTGTWKQIGKAEFGNTAYLFAAGSSLFSIEKDGSLYRMDPGDGSWARVGEAGAWQATRAGVILKGRLYTVENSGGLYGTDLGRGTWRQLGKPEFADTNFLFAAGENLYTIETDGSLYRVSVK